MTKKTRRKIDVAPRSVSIASTISGSLYGTCSICLFRIVFDPTWLQDRPSFKLVCLGRGLPRSASLEVTILTYSRY
jgi:hypothetical protein